MGTSDSAPSKMELMEKLAYLLPNQKGEDFAKATHIFSVPARHSFLESVAESLAGLFEIGASPLAFAEAEFYLPNRRAALSFAECLRKMSGKAAIALPRIKTLGDVIHDEALSFLNAEQVLPAIVSENERLKFLTAAAMRLPNQQAALPIKGLLGAYRIAEEIASLLDSAAFSEKIDWNQLDVTDLNHLPAHLQAAANVLPEIIKAWHGYLSDTGQMDVMSGRREASLQLARHWNKAKPAHPVILMGSTGSAFYTRELMASVAGLRRGAVILPGVHTVIDDEALKHVKRTPGHEQYALVRSLAHLGLTPSQAQIWPGKETEPTGDETSLLWSEALLPAPMTANWRERLSGLSGGRAEAQFLEKAISATTLLTPEDEFEEAYLCALIMREYMATQGDGICALVTPDPILSTRISAALRRWDINVSPSSGSKLNQSPKAQALHALNDWIEDRLSSSKMLALLRMHETMGKRDTGFAAAVSMFEKLVFRERRQWSTLQAMRDYCHNLSERDLKTKAETTPESWEEAYGLVLPLLEALHQKAEAFLNGFALKADSLDHYLSILDFYGAGRFFTGSDGLALSETIDSLEALTALKMRDGDSLTAHDFIAVLHYLTAQKIIAPETAEHPHLKIWGPLEARLQKADRIILAGLNEGFWPEVQQSGAFLSREMRQQIGLPDLDERLGLEAHDFIDMVLNDDVFLLCAKRREGAPVVRSRWIWRLQTIMAGLLQDDDAAQALILSNSQKWSDYADYARPLSAAKPVSAPKPTPPLKARPKRFSVTRIEKFLRDPYAIYAENILRLKKLPDLDAPREPALMGSLWHKVVEVFELREELKTADDLVALLFEEASVMNLDMEELDFKQELITETAEKYVDWWQPRSKAHVECAGELGFDIKGIAYTLIARADRIEIVSEVGDAILIDFKTGKLPSTKQVKERKAPQLPLQAHILLEGGFKTDKGKDLQASDIGELNYIELKPDFKVQSVKLDNDEAAYQDYFDKIRNYIAFYHNEDTPYLSQIMPFKQGDKGDYDALARRAEWVEAGEDD